MKSQKLIKNLRATVPYAVIGLSATKLSQAVRLTPGAAASEKFLRISEGVNMAFASPLPSFYYLDMLVGFCVAAAFRLAVYVKSQNPKQTSKGTEYGSARWGNEKDIAPFIDPVFENNIILSETEFLTMNSRPKDISTARNKNVLVIGGSGSGKTFFYVTSNILQLNCSFVITDPKGGLLIECGKVLHDNGYEIRVLNTINFKKSMHYNPFAYIHSEKDILKLVTVLMNSTKNSEKTGGDEFWEKAEQLLYMALIGYIHYELPEKEQNLGTMVQMINAMEVREDDEEFQNSVDQLFAELKKRDPGHFAVRQYDKFKLAAGKTAKSILISCATRLAPFDIQELRELTAFDELELDLVGDRKTALFLIMSDTDPTFNFLIAMVYTQLFNLLCERADDKYGGRLPIHVRCLMDEVANIGQIPHLEKLMATIRSREISASLILQAQSQLKALYKDNADTVIGNCDTSIFLGGKEPTTLKELNTALGKRTIDYYNLGESRGRENTHSVNYQKLGKDLMSIDELAVMPGNKCIVQVRGVRPFYSDKYNVTRHPNFKYTSHADPKNKFDLDSFLKARLKLHGNDQFEVFELTDEIMASNVPAAKPIGRS